MENKGKINNITGIFMIAIALFIDVLQIFFTLVLIGPFINWLISLFTYLTFWLWFTLNGVKFTKNPKNFFMLNGGALVEIIPILANLPAWTLTITTLVIMNKIKIT